MPIASKLCNYYTTRAFTVRALMETCSHGPLVPSQYLLAAACDRSMGIEAARTTTLPLNQPCASSASVNPASLRLCRDIQGDSRSAGGRDHMCEMIRGAWKKRRAAATETRAQQVYEYPVYEQRQGSPGQK